MSDLNLIKPKYVQNIINKFCYTIGMIPTSYKVSLTYEEQIIAIGHYLEETVIPALNNNAEAVAELQSLFVQLKDYVENYFTNLDVQEEINNKLDSMVTDGTLPEIIASYLNSKAVFGFDNVDSMKNATNLIDGSYAQTLGYHTKNDGGMNVYKIRHIDNQDVVDEGLIISLNNPELIAELIIKDYVTPEMFGAYGDNIHDDTMAIQKCLNHNIRHAILSKTYKTTTPLSVPSWKIVDGGGEIHSSGIGFLLDGVRFVHLNDLKIYAITSAVKISTVNNYCAHNILENLFCSGDGVTPNTKGLHLSTTNYYMNEQTYKNCTFWNYDYGIYAEDDTEGYGTKEMSRHMFQYCSMETSKIAGQYIKNGINFTFDNCRTIEVTSAKWITEGICYHLLIKGGDAWFITLDNANFSTGTSGEIIGALRDKNHANNSASRNGLIINGKIVPYMNDINRYRKDITQSTTISYGDELYTNFRFLNDSDVTLTLPSEIFGGISKINEFYVRLKAGSGNVTIVIGDVTKTIPTNSSDAKHYRLTFNSLAAEHDWFVETIN